MNTDVTAARPDLSKVHWDNVRANQIGGLKDGMPAHVARDLGFTHAVDDREAYDNRPPARDSGNARLAWKTHLDAARMSLEATRRG